jgi:CrcB protein
VASQGSTDSAGSPAFESPAFEAPSSSGSSSSGPSEAPAPGPGPSAPAGRPPHFTPTYLLLVFIGGMGGTLARFGLAQALPTPAGLPLGIFLINIAGAFALGLLLEALAQRGPDEGRRRAIRLLLGTGFLGGFTTYSALAVDSALLLGSGRVVEGIAYLAGSVLLGLIATAAGIAMGARARRGPRAGRRSRPGSAAAPRQESGPDTSTGMTS